MKKLKSFAVVGLAILIAGVVLVACGADWAKGDWRVATVKIVMTNSYDDEETSYNSIVTIEVDVDAGSLSMITLENEITQMMMTANWKEDTYSYYDGTRTVSGKLSAESAEQYNELVEQYKKMGEAKLKFADGKVESDSELFGSSADEVEGVEVEIAEVTTYKIDSSKKLTMTTVSGEGEDAETTTAIGEKTKKGMTLSMTGIGEEEGMQMTINLVKVKK